MSLKNECRLEISSKSSLSFEAMMRWVAGVAEILTLATGAAVYGIDIECISTADDGTSETCQVLQKVRRSSEMQDVPEHEMLFTLKDVRTSSSNIIENYLRNREQYSPFIGLFFGTFYNSTMYLEHRLLSLCHAAEAFHRVMAGGKYLPDPEYEQTVKSALVAAIPPGLKPGFRRSLGHKLKYLHEYSLRKRLCDLCVPFAPLLPHLIPKPPDFAERVANLRNALTHRDSGTDAQIPDVGEFFATCETVALLLELCLLKLLGFDDQVLKRTAEASPRVMAIKLNSRG